MPRTDIPPRPLAPVQPPPGPFPTLRGRLTSKERRKRHVIPHETPVVTPPVIEVQEQQVQIEPRSDTKLPEGADATPADSKIKTAYTAADIAGFLRSSTGQRNAIIFREIFGPPRSLQPLDRNLARAGPEARLTGRTPVLQRRRGGIGRRAGLKIQ